MLRSDAVPRDGRRQHPGAASPAEEDRKSTRLNSSHLVISYAVFCLKKKKTATDDPFQGQVRCPRDQVSLSLHLSRPDGQPPPPLSDHICSYPRRPAFTCAADPRRDF